MPLVRKVRDITASLSLISGPSLFHVHLHSHSYYLMSDFFLVSSFSLYTVYVST